MSKNFYNPPPEGLRITHPMAVYGFYRKYRTIVEVALLTAFFLLPWIKINGFPAILIDIPHRRFSLFGLQFWGHDTPMLFFVMASFSMGIVFATSAWGRVWCGWACPQTVFIGAIFRKIESFVEGGHIARIKLRKAPFHKEKLIKKTVKWSLFFLTSTVISHTILAYFAGAENLVSMIAVSPFKNWAVFLTTGIVTIVVMLNFGWFREQLCISICPYGRLQSVLMDEDSLAIIYDEKRGEPRKGLQPKTEEPGDCINCYKCVAVCPTGIDIRKGLQMECIACTACIDACDTVMATVKKPKGLIRYESENGLRGRPSGFWRIKNMIYLGLVSACLIGLVSYISNRSDLDITVLRAQESPYRVITRSREEPLISNHYTLNLKNQSFHEIEVDIKHAEDSRNKGIEIIAPTYPEMIAPGKTTKNHFFITFPKSLLSEKGQLNFQLHIAATSNNKTTRNYIKELTLAGPVK
ncbi:MAG: cytochrome c oxidase accessory protein CcoG [Planctomycetes bacterium RBG_16_41_13]|nr:MAG: cytochrome c oxidase accessory protein CcoG [Planctomycetes bacterium RBG_16_41_13]